MFTKKSGAIPSIRTRSQQKQRLMGRSFLILTRSWRIQWFHISRLTGNKHWILECIASLDTVLSTGPQKRQAHGVDPSYWFFWGGIAASGPTLRSMTSYPCWTALQGAGIMKHI